MQNPDFVVREVDGYNNPRLVLYDINGYVNLDIVVSNMDGYNKEGIFVHYMNGYYTQVLLSKTWTIPKSENFWFSIIPVKENQKLKENLVLLFL